MSRTGWRLQLPDKTIVRNLLPQIDAVCGCRQLIPVSRRQAKYKLSVKDIFNQRSQTLYSNLPGIGYTFYEKPETRLLGVGVSYSFGGKEVKATRKRASGIEEERGRIGNIR